MKLGIVSREYPPLTHVGGIATYSAAAARLLAERGHDVHVVCNGPETAVSVEDGVTVHRVRMLTHHFRPGRLGYPWRAAYRRYLPQYLDALTWARTAAAYVAGLPWRDFDAWEWPETMGEGALLPPMTGETAGAMAGGGNAPGSHASGKPAPRGICRIHTGWMEEYAGNALERRLLLAFQRRACRNAARVVSPTRYMADVYARGILGHPGTVTVNRNPIRLWPAPVDWSAKSMDHVLYVGRVEWRKGLQVLLAALDAMGPAADGLKVRVVGHMHPPSRARDRECQDLFRARLAERGRGAGGAGYNLEYAGACAHDGMRKHYDWAGILVLPSLMENYPYAALEGLSRGCLLVGSRVGGIPEIIDRPGRGQLFPPGDSAFLARIMGECRQRGFLPGAERPGTGGSLPEALAENAEAMRAEFGPEACYRRLLEGYGFETGNGKSMERRDLPAG